MPHSSRIGESAWRLVILPKVVDMEEMRIDRSCALSRAVPGLASSGVLARVGQ